MAKKWGGKYDNDRASVQLITRHEVAPEDTGAERNDRQPGTRRVSAGCAAGKGRASGGQHATARVLGRLRARAWPFQRGLRHGSR